MTKPKTYRTKTGRVLTDAEAARPWVRRRPRSSPSASTQSCATSSTWPDGGPHRRRGRAGQKCAECADQTRSTIPPLWDIIEPGAFAWPCLSTTTGLPSIPTPPAHEVS